LRFASDELVDQRFDFSHLRFDRLLILDHLRFDLSHLGFDHFLILGHLSNLGIANLKLLLNHTSKAIDNTFEITNFLVKVLTNDQNRLVNHVILWAEISPWVEEHKEVYYAVIFSIELLSKNIEIPCFLVHHGLVDIRDNRNDKV